MDLQDEAQEGFDGSYRDFYLMENPRCSRSDAEAHMRSLIAREWEELNRECLCKRTFSSSFTHVCLNAARMISVMYSYNKEQRLLVLEDYARMLILWSFAPWTYMWDNVQGWILPSLLPRTRLEVGVASILNLWWKRHICLWSATVQGRHHNDPYLPM